MIIRLTDLEACFEGVIPSIVATASSDGVPNISYLSHVVMVDADHVALSNQFFSKTAANVRANPRAAVLIVDPHDGAQFRLALTFERAIDGGPLFDNVVSHLRTSSAQVGMSGVMRLKGLDVYRVRSITPVPQTTADPAVADAKPQRLPGLARITAGIADAGDVEGVIEATFAGLQEEFGYEHALILLQDGVRQVLTTIGSHGYLPTGIGSEVPIGEGLIGSVFAERRSIKISDMSRARRFGAAITASSAEENRTRNIAVPGSLDAMSQIGIPITALGATHGVLFVESSERLAFTSADEQALAVLARSLGSALFLAEARASDVRPHLAEPTAAPQANKVFRVVHHPFDDSVFIENEYIIKGVPGRLLMFMLEMYEREGRCDFSNREFRHSEGLRLPEFKDNLETRLLLLRRRLEEKGSPLQLIRTGRGRLRLNLDGAPVLDRRSP